MAWTGLTPVFAEVDADTTNLDPARVEELVTSRTTAIVAVHNFGNPADIAELEAVAARRGLKLVFDAAHGFGASWQGVPVGGQGDANVFSLSPTKLLVAGEGGVVATNDDQLARAVRLGREYGNDGNYDSAFAGLNARMPELSALVGFAGLARLDQVARRRRAQARQYQALLSELPGLSFTVVRPGNESSYKDFSIVVDAEEFGADRDSLARELESAGIDTRKYYDPPVHRQKAYRHFATDVRLPITDMLASSSLSLPMGPQLDEQRIQFVCEVIRDTHERARRGVLGILS
jgi:dTDP-4-amino-4,6-dideoxygalactose transaminase